MFSVSIQKVPVPKSRGITGRFYLTCVELHHSFHARRNRFFASLNTRSRWAFVIISLDIAAKACMFGVESAAQTDKTVHWDAFNVFHLSLCYMYLFVGIPRCIMHQFARINQPVLWFLVAKFKAYSNSKTPRTIWITFVETTQTRVFTL